MNEELKQQIEQIIREELSAFISVGGYNFDRPIKVFDARHIQLGKSNGTKIGTEATQKLAFYGTTPIIQQSAIGAPSGGATQDTQARTAITSLIAALKNIGITQ